MAKTKIIDFHKFIIEDLPKRIRRVYRSFHIYSEADLQFQVCNSLNKFVLKHKGKANVFKILNKPFLKDLGLHPDLAVFRKGKPWLIFELKEMKTFNKGAIEKDIKRLKDFAKYKKSRNMRLGRGYLLYIAWGENKPNELIADSTYVIPIMCKFDDEWRDEYNRWRKYRVKTK
jgi:hypothetical protein